MDTLRNYTFLSWLRQGIASEISVPDNLGAGGTAPQRAQVPVQFHIGSETVSKPVELLGPGDVVGIHPAAIVKTEPRHWVTDFEANYLPYIEFYEEEFPWRFTPAKATGDLAQSRLRPWIFLVVLGEDEFDEAPSAGPLPAFKIKDGLDLDALFPDKEQTWAWAHVHVNQNVIGATLHTQDAEEVRAVEQNLENLLGANPDNASSRLLCPRRLKENTAYHAFVIPAFETGRLAGLGQSIEPPIDEETMDGQQASWGSGQTDYPIYYRWFFHTGAKGDFEFLVDLLEPRAVDPRVGVRDMDMQEPGYGVDGMAPPLDVMSLEGALKSLETEPFPPQWPPQNADFEDPPDGSAGEFLNELEKQVNLQFVLQQEETGDHEHPDPIVSPPLYGKWYAQAEKLEAQSGTGWVNALNRDPRYRAASGVGTRVIQNDQENLMQQAWSQLGDLPGANQKIRQLQLGLMSSYVMFRKHVVTQSDDRFLGFTAPVHARVLGSPVTVARQVTESRLPRAALDPAFRKLMRNRGAIMKKVAVDEKTPRTPVVIRLNTGDLTAAPAAPEPTGAILQDAVADTISDKYPDVAMTFRESSFTSYFAGSIPQRPGFVLAELRKPGRGEGKGEGDSAEAANFRLALTEAFGIYEARPPAPPERPPLSIGTTVQKLKQALDPSTAIPKRAQFLLKIPIKVRDAYLRPHKTLVSVMAHPVFTQPMYRPMRDISSELLAPNLELIPNNTVSLMQTNEPFIEAYMVGLNHEMGGELLWREYPTDQRGSYFRQFWDVGDVVQRDPNKTPAQIAEELLDITRLHTWDRTTDLGQHQNRPLPNGESRLVLVVRGDLLRKYPTAVIYAQKAMWTTDEDRDIRVLDDRDPGQNIKHPAFKAEIEPDVRFLGFDLTRTAAEGNPDPDAADPGWFFVIQERPGEPRFGLDVLSDDSPLTATEWNELAWEHIGDPATLRFIDTNADVAAAIPAGSTDSPFEWGRNAADMAYILYQVPVMVAFHADDMLP